jgi:hypothetical protein
MFAPFSLETELLARWKANTLENAQPRAAFRKKRAMFRRQNLMGRVEQTIWNVPRQIRDD